MRLVWYRRVLIEYTRMSPKSVTLTISENNYTKINFGTFSIAQILLILGLNTWAKD